MVPAGLKENLLRYLDKIVLGLLAIGWVTVLVWGVAGQGAGRVAHELDSVNSQAQQKLANPPAPPIQPLGYEPIAQYLKPSRAPETPRRNPFLFGVTARATVRPDLNIGGPFSPPAELFLRAEPGQVVVWFRAAPGTPADTYFVVYRIERSRYQEKVDQLMDRATAVAGGFQQVAGPIALNEVNEGQALDGGIVEFTDYLYGVAAARAQQPETSSQPETTSMPPLDPGSRDFLYQLMLWRQRQEEQQAEAEEAAAAPVVTEIGATMRVAAIRSAEAVRMKLVSVAPYANSLQARVMVERLVAAKWLGKEFRVAVGDQIGKAETVWERIPGERRPIRHDMDLTTGATVVNFSSFKHSVEEELPTGKKRTREVTLWNMEYRDKEGTTRTLTQQYEPPKTRARRERPTEQPPMPFPPPDDPYFRLR